MDAIAPEALLFQTGYLRPSARRSGTTDRCPADWLGYPNRDEYQGLGQPIHLVAVEFSEAARSLAGFEAAPG